MKMLRKTQCKMHRGGANNMIFHRKHKTGREKSFSSPDWTPKNSELPKKSQLFKISSPFFLPISPSETHLHQRHLGAEGQQDFFRLGGVGVVPVFVEPLLERPRHVLQGLALVSHFAAVGTNPVRGRRTVLKSRVTIRVTMKRNKRPSNFGRC